jgi:hypothetical protein
MPPAKGPLWKYFIAGTKQNGSHIRAHCQDYIEKKNHDPSGVSQLLAVPRYADLLENDAGASENEEGMNLKPRSGLVKSCAGWQKEMAKWVVDEQT